MTCICEEKEVQQEESECMKQKHIDRLRPNYINPHLSTASAGAVGAQYHHAVRSRRLACRTRRTCWGWKPNSVAKDVLDTCF